MKFDPTRYWPEGGLRRFQEHPAFCPVEIVDAAQARLDVRGRTKLAIVGFSLATRHEAPYDDPSWVVVGLNQLYRFLPRADLWIEVHEKFLDDQVPGTDYLAWLQTCGIPVLMPAVHPAIPTSVRFPIEEALALAGDIWRPTPEPIDYYQSSVAYLLLWGILLGFKEIGVWGVDLTVGEEYFYQKPNAEFWLGFARGRGVTLHLPPNSALVKQVGPRYGRADNLIAEARKLDRMYARRQTFLEAERAKQVAIATEALKTIDQMDAALAETALWKHINDLHARGSVTEYDDPPEAHQPAPKEVWAVTQAAAIKTVADAAIASIRAETATQLDINGARIAAVETASKNGDRA